MTSRLTRLLAIVLAFGLVAAACGSDGDSDSGGDDDVSTATTAAGTTDTEAAPATTLANEDTEIVEETADRKSGGDIVVGLEAEATGLRPWEDTCSSPCYNISVTVYDKLMEQTLDGSYQGWLAELIQPNEDFTAWVMTLRPDVTFHNGTPLTAQTIVDMFQIQLEGAQSSGAIGSSNLSDVQATGDLEVTYVLSQPNSAFPAFLSRAPLGMVFEPAAALADPDGFSTDPVGTGPFMMESRDLDNSTVVERNPNYWRTDADGTQLPYLDSITFRPIPDEGTRLDSLLSGTVDAFQTLRQGTIRDARDSDDITLLEYQGSNVGGGMYNVLVPPLDDVRVRRALTMMNNQEAVIEALGGTGISAPGTQWFSPDSPWYSEAAAAAWPEFDFEGGVALLQEYVDDPARSDGKTPGDSIDVELSCPPDPTLIAAMQVIEQLWSTSGLVDVELTAFDQQTHINNALGAPPDFAGTHQAHCWRWSDDNDPSTTLNPALAPPNPAVAEAAGIPEVVSPLNFSNWFNGDAFTAAIGALRTGTFEERFALYEQINLLIAEETPIWYSGYTATAIGTRPELKGLNGWTLPGGDLGIGFSSAEGRWGEAFLDE